MDSDQNRRIAQRHEVQTTPVQWKVPRYRRGSSQPKLVLADAAIVEVSILGAGLVAPERLDHLVGARVELFFEELAGWVSVRRMMPYRSSERLVFYGVEYAAMQSALGMAIYERLVVAGEQVSVVDAFDPVAGAKPEPQLWSAPIDWTPGR